MHHSGASDHSNSKVYYTLRPRYGKRSSWTREPQAKGSQVHVEGHRTVWCRDIHTGLDDSSGTSELMLGEANFRKGCVKRAELVALQNWG